MADEHRSHIAGERFGGDPSNVTGGFADLLRMVFDEIANRVHNLELVGQQLRRRNLLQLCDALRRGRYQGCIRVGHWLIAAKDDEVFSSHRYQQRVLGPVRSNHPHRLAASAGMCWPARALNPGDERLSGERQIYDPTPTEASPAASEQAEPSCGDTKDQGVGCQAPWRLIRRGNPIHKVGCSRIR